MNSSLFQENSEFATLFKIKQQPKNTNRQLSSRCKNGSRNCLSKNKTKLKRKEKTYQLSIIISLSNHILFTINKITHYINKNNHRDSNFGRLCNDVWQLETKSNNTRHIYLFINFIIFSLWRKNRQIKKKKKKRKRYCSRSKIQGQFTKLTATSETLKHTPSWMMRTRRWWWWWSEFLFRALPLRIAECTIQFSEVPSGFWFLFFFFYK